jgi:hypothetical protein
MAKPLRMTVHGNTALRERGIELRWVETAISQPDWTALDPHPDRTRAFKIIPERDRRILRVVYAETLSEIRLITAFFDRDAKKP